VKDVPNSFARDSRCNERNITINVGVGSVWEYSPEVAWPELELDSCPYFLGCLARVEEVLRSFGWSRGVRGGFAHVAVVRVCKHVSVIVTGRKVSKVNPLKPCSKLGWNAFLEVSD